MSTCQITEYRKVLFLAGVNVPVPVGTPLAVQEIDCSSAAAKSAALNADTRFVRILAIGGDVNFRFSAVGGTASSIVTASDDAHERFVQSREEWRAFEGDPSANAGFAVTAS